MASFPWWLPLGDESMGGEVAQGLVRLDGVVGALPGQAVLVQGTYLQGALLDIIEFLRTGAASTLLYHFHPEVKWPEYR